MSEVRGHQVLITTPSNQGLASPVHWKCQGCRGPGSAEDKQDIQHCVLSSGIDLYHQSLGKLL